MDSHTHSGPAGRLEVVETGRRRRWSIEEKLRIVSESLSGPRLASATARRHDPRQEPGAVVPLAGICAGGDEKSSSLPRQLRSDEAIVGVAGDIAALSEARLIARLL